MVTRYTGWEMFPLPNDNRNDGSVYVKASDYDALTAENERLKADAARYRWLRDNCYVWGSDAIVSSHIQIEAAALWLLGSTDISEDGIDAAIDAALKEDE